jgi:hypothetical protein
MKFLLAPFIAVAALGAAASAHAQDWRPERPYRGLFANGVGDTEQLLTASGSIGTSWDKNVITDVDGRSFLIGDGTGRFQGGAMTGSATLSYSLSRSRAAFGASAGTTARYYPRLSNQFIRREYASIGTSVVLGAGFSARAGATYQPYSLGSMFPWLLEPRVDEAAVVEEDFPTSTEHFASYSAGVGFTRRVSRRQTFSATYNYRGRTASGVLDRFEGHSAGARLTRVLGRGLGLRLGYTYSEAHYHRREGRFTDHHIDVGVDYSRALSFSRRTTLSFGTGTSAARSARAPLRYRATGMARLNHEIGRTWSAALSYSRGLQFVETWPEPVFADSASAMVGGLINRRAQLQMVARALRGSGYSGRSGDVTSYGGAIALAVAVTRYINTGLTYNYYQHGFARGIALAPGFPHDFDGHTIRASVNVWAPLFQRARRP